MRSLEMSIRLVLAKPRANWSATRRARVDAASHMEKRARSAVRATARHARHTTADESDTSWRCRLSFPIAARTAPARFFRSNALRTEKKSEAACSTWTAASAALVWFRSSVSRRSAVSRSSRSTCAATSPLALCHLDRNCLSRALVRCAWMPAATRTPAPMRRCSAHVVVSSTTRSAASFKVRYFHRAKRAPSSAPFLCAWMPETTRSAAPLSRTRVHTASSTSRPAMVSMRQRTKAERR